MNTDERAEIIQQRTRDTMKLDPTVPFHLGGTERVMVFNNRALKDILTDTGLNLLRDPLTLEHLTDPKTLSAIIYRGLQAKWPEVTLDTVDEMLNMRHFMYYQTQITVAMSLFYPDIKDLPKFPDAEPEPTGDPT
jgi:hypothetical protein